MKTRTIFQGWRATACAQAVVVASVVSIAQAQMFPAAPPIAAPADPADLVEWRMEPYPLFATGSVVRADAWLFDGPAGKHGPVKAMPDGSMQFADGTPARFWGTTTIYGGTFPEKREEVVKLADAIASRGYNLVRFHHNDIHWRGIGIMQNKPASNVKLDPVDMDRLDFFAAELIKRGVYLYLDLVDYRAIIEGEGVFEAFPDMRNLAKSTELFGWKGLFPHPAVVDLWKRSATEILDHRNPYTGRAWGEEPAVATIEIINENGPFWDWSFKVSDGVHRWYDAEWNAWLLAKYGSREKLDAAWTDGSGTRGLFAGEDPAKGNVFRPRLTPLLDWDRPYRSKTRGAARVNDYYAHLAETASGFFGEAERHLRNLGFKGLVIGSHELRGAIDLKSLSVTGTVGAHLYTRPLTAWHARPDSSGSTVDGVDVKTKNWFSNIPRIKLPGMPSINGEWAAGSPIYRADANIAVAAATAWQGIDQSLHFGYLYRWAGVKMPDHDLLFDWKHYLNRISMTYSSAHDIPWMAVNRMCAALFIRGDFKKARHSVEIGCSDEDVHEQNLHALGISGGNGTIGNAALFLPLMHDVQCRFFDKAYDGDADVVFMTGRSASGDYSKARHAVLVGDNPYNDRYHKSRDIGVPARLARPGVVVETLGTPVSFEVAWPYTTPRSLGYDQYEGAVRLDSLPTGAQPIGRSADGQYTMGWLDDKFLVLPNGRAFAKKAGDIRWLYRLYLEAAKRWGVDVADNTVDGTFYSSDTRELRVDWAHGTLDINTPRTQGFSGFPGWRAENKADNFACKVEAPYGNILVTSADGRPIFVSRRLLLVAAGRMQNTGQQYAADPDGAVRISNVGKGPCLVEALRGTVVLGLADPETKSVYALDQAGRRLGKVESNVSGGMLGFDLSPRWRTIWYEIADGGIAAPESPPASAWPGSEPAAVAHPKPRLVPLAEILPPSSPTTRAAATQAAATAAGDMRLTLARIEPSQPFVGSYGNIKLTRTNDSDAGSVVEAQFGKVTTGWSGGLWMPLQSPGGLPRDAVSAFGIKFRGDGTLPRDTFLALSLADGGKYTTAKNINSMFENDAWSDVLFTPSDFIVDREYAKANPEAAKALPETPHLGDITRIDFTCVGPLMDHVSVGRIAEIFLVVKNAADVVRDDVAASLPKPQAPVTRNVEIPHVPGVRLVADGVPDEPFWKNAFALAMDESKVPEWHSFGSHVVGGKRLHDEAADFWAVATDEGLAVFARVDKGGRPIVAERDQLYECDAVEVFTDPGLGGKRPAAQVFLAYRTRAANLPASNAAGVRISRVLTASGYAIEALIPWKALGFESVPSEPFGLEFQVDFSAPGAGRALQMAYATGTNDAWISAEHYLQAALKRQVASRQRHSREDE
ncbi:MAG: sugar-binding protein [Kiritimatiellia bacterium]|jgi:hypothetical protein